MNGAANIPMQLAEILGGQLSDPGSAAYDPYFADPLTQFDLNQIGPQLFAQRKEIPVEAVYARYPKMRPLDAPQAQSRFREERPTGPIEGVMQARQQLLDALGGGR